MHHLKRAKPLQFTMPNGMKVFGLNLNDSLAIYHELFDSHCYRQHGVDFHDGDCILDVGANTGLFVRYLHHLGIRAHVYSFEPIPQIFDVLNWNVADLDNIEVETFNIGLARHSGKASFTYYPRLSQASTLRADDSPEAARRGRDYALSQAHTLPRPLSFLFSILPQFVRNGIAEAVRKYYLKKEMVPCKLENLSDFLRTHQIGRVDLLKIDAESSEQAILGGLAESDWPKIQQVALEAHDGAAATTALVRQLESHGFQVTARVNSAMPSLSHLFAVRAETRRNKQAPAAAGISI